jgi:hypothetical protein
MSIQYTEISGVDTIRMLVATDDKCVMEWVPWADKGTPRKL